MQNGNVPWQISEAIMATLTDEQKEMIRKNREKALEIRRKREAGLKQAEETKREAEGSAKKKRKISEEEEEDVELEDFEIDASEFVSKKEAKQTYCLPDGTLEVCSFVEKENPRHKGWTPMKLYDRAEIRRRARKRHGGLEGLRAERERRLNKRFQNDLESTKDVFK